MQRSGARLITKSPVIWKRAFQTSHLTQNDDSHKQFLSKYYSPEILKSIEAAESAIKPEHWGNRRNAQTEFAPKYLDDFSKFDKFWDLPTTPQRDFEKAHQPVERQIPPGHSLPEGFTNQRQVMANELAKLTGLNPQYIMKLTVKPLVMKRVSNQTGKGKIKSHYALVVVGDRNGMVGVGEGKDGVDMGAAIRKGHWNAVKDLQQIPRLDERTIYGDLTHKFGSTLVTLRSAPSGFGLRVNRNIFEICECAGIKDLGGKVFRSRNPMNVVKATIEALHKQKTLREIAVQRGKKVLDLKDVYYSR